MSSSKFFQNKTALITLIAASIVVIISLGVRQTFGLFYLDFSTDLDISITQVASIVGFYTLYYAHSGGKNRIQICTDLPCALRGADDFADKVCEKLGVKLGETTEDGEFTVESVMCLAACDKAPMFQVQNGDGITYHERQTISDVQAVIEQLGNAEIDKNPEGTE